MSEIETEDDAAGIARLVKSAMGKIPFTAPEQLEERVRLYIETAWKRGKARGAVPVENAHRPSDAVSLGDENRSANSESSERRIEERLVVTDLCDMHAFHKDASNGRMGEVLRRAIKFIEGEESAAIPRTSEAWGADIVAGRDALGLPVPPERRPGQAETSYIEDLDEDQRTPEVRISKALTWTGIHSDEAHAAVQKVARAIYDEALRSTEAGARRGATLADVDAGIEAGRKLCAFAKGHAQANHGEVSEQIDIIAGLFADLQARIGAEACTDYALPKQACTTCGTACGACFVRQVEPSLLGTPCDRCGARDMTMKTEGTFLFCWDRLGCDARKRAGQILRERRAGRGAVPPVAECTCDSPNTGGWDCPVHDATCLHLDKKCPSWKACAERTAKTSGERAQELLERASPQDLAAAGIDPAEVKRPGRVVLLEEQLHEMWQTESDLRARLAGQTTEAVVDRGGDIGRARRWLLGTRDTRGEDIDDLVDLIAESREDGRQLGRGQAFAECLTTVHAVGLDDTIEDEASEIRRRVLPMLKATGNDPRTETATPKSVK